MIPNAPMVGLVSNTVYGQQQSASWSPALLTPVAWYRADDLGLGGGTQVASWTDLSGNGNHATQATPALRPIVAKGALNSHDTVAFNGSRYLQATFTLNQPFTLYVVTRNITSAASKVLVDGNTSATQFGGDGSGNAFFYAGSSVPFGVSMAQAAGKQWGALVSGGNATLRFSAAQVATGACGAGNPAGLSLGASWSGAGGIVGEIAELIVVPRIISASEITSLETYNTSRYAV